MALCPHSCDADRVDIGGTITRREAVRSSAAAVALLALDASPAPARSLRHRRRHKHRHEPATGDGGPPTGSALPDPGTIAGGGNPADLELVECAALLQGNMLSSSELTGACLRRITDRTGPLNAWVRIYETEALAMAAAADSQLARAAVRRTGHRPPLVSGVPIGLKDLYAVAGELLTASSKILAGNRPMLDCPVWASLSRSGMVLLGHAQTHEFAAGNFTPQSSNPWDTRRTPGGSSGGSAIALATRMLPAATGSDTLGSLRIPASLCGVSALKPTRGLVSTQGLIPLAESFDHAGPIARSARDLALLLSYMTSTTQPPAYLVRPQAVAKPLQGVRIGIPDQTFGGLTATAAIAARVAAFSAELVQLGAVRVAFTAPRSAADNLSSPSGTQFFLTVPGAEINRYHRRYFPQRAADYTPDVATVLTLLRDANTIAPDPKTGAATVAQLTAAWTQAFKDHRLDAVLQPAALIETPTKANAEMQTMSIGDPMVVWDYTGFPALCLPAGPSSASGLPIGVQLIGPPGRDGELLRIGIEAQAHYPHHTAEPPGLP